MHRLLYIPSLVIFFSATLMAQNSTKGVVIDEVSGVPIEAAHVFIAHSEMGTLTDAEGYFEINNLPKGKHELVISFIGYAHETKTIQTPNFINKPLVIKMKERASLLEVVKVTAKQSRKRKRNLRAFTKAILGATDNAEKCKILNPEVILLHKKDGELTATTTDLIEIENLGTGYKMFFLLENFSQKKKEVTYAGKPFFIPLLPKNDSQQKKWKKNRRKSYKGSRRHFLHTLAKGTSSREGFRVFHAYQKPDGSLEEGNPVRYKQIINKTAQKNIHALRFNQFLKVVYLKEDDEISVRNNSGSSNTASFSRREERDVTQHLSGDEVAHRQPQISYLFARKSTILFNTQGTLLSPELLVQYFYWTHEGLAESLPLTYQSTEISKKESSWSSKKDFLLSKLKIPFEEIMDGGPPKGGIPAIDNPQFISAENANFLNKNDQVIGVIENGKAKAYPIRILDLHEIVNDEKLSITWCPLCGSGIVFANENKHSFGVSGLLYNSDVLLYDRETESLWSQILGEAVAGKLSGEKLSIYPSLLTTWEEWLKSNPTTEVLSTETGFTNDYSKIAYEKYLNQEKLMFPVAHQNKILPNKERVLGITIAGQYKAYPFSVLSQQISPIQDDFNGAVFLIHFDAENQAAFAESVGGQSVEYFTLFWFAWYAFHPETEVFE